MQGERAGVEGLRCMFEPRPDTRGSESNALGGATKKAPENGQRTRFSSFFYRSEVFILLDLHASQLHVLAVYMAARLRSVGVSYDHCLERRELEDCYFIEECSSLTSGTFSHGSITWNC